MGQNASPPLIAGGTINPSRFVKVSTSADNTCLQCGVGDRPIGISQVGIKTAPGVDGAQTYAATTGDPISIFGLGDTPVLLEAGGSWTAGDLLAPDSNGKGVTATAGQPVGAIALEAVSSGEFGRVQVLNMTNGGALASGSGGTVTQITSSSTGVTLNKVTGQITTVALTTAAAAEERFTVTNSQVAATDVVVFATTYAGAGTPAIASAIAVTDGTFDVVITNLHASAALNAAMTINFVVLKGATS